MPRKRMIDPGIWRNKGFLRTSRDARILFIGLITYADDCGYGDADPMALRLSVFPGDSDISDTDMELFCTELVTVGLIELKNGLYRLPGWDNFQKLRSDYKLDDKYKRRWYAPVTEPARPRNVPVTEPAPKQVSKAGKVSKASKPEKKTPARSKTTKRPDVDAVRKCLKARSAEFSLTSMKIEKEKFYPMIQQLINESKVIDVDPLGVISIWDPTKRPTPIPLLRTIRKNPDEFRDKVGKWGDFIELVYPVKHDKNRGPTNVADTIAGLKLGRGGGNESDHAQAQ